MRDWAGLATLGFFALVFLFFIYAFVKKARQRRRELTEDEAPISTEDRELIAEAEGSAHVELPAEPAHAPEEAVLPAEPPPEEEEEEKAPPPVDAALEKGLARTKEGFLGKLNALFARRPAVDPKLYEELEEILLTADVGVGLTGKLVAELRTRRAENAEALRLSLKSRLSEVLAHNGNGNGNGSLETGPKRPHVILFVGVNGVGKTTTIGKIAQKYRDAGKSVALAAGDTFRAAAVEQLGIWAQRTGSTLFKGETNADPASVVFNAVQSAVAQNVDVLLADTAGRLHTKTELMDEIKKVKRAIGKARDGAPDETWLVVDATTGQNALQQAKEFNTALELSGVILTKLDGTAKGGVVLAIADGLKIPVRYIGVGETAQDLRPFDPRGFVEALLG
jgi:fused signal recognition particle receptor